MTIKMKKVLWNGNLRQLCLTGGWLQQHTNSNQWFSLLLINTVHLTRYALDQGWAISGPRTTCGPWKHLGKIFKSEIFSNLSQLISVLRLTWTETCFYFHCNRFVHLYYAHQQFIFTQRCLERRRHSLPKLIIKLDLTQVLFFRWSTAVVY